MKIDSSIKSTTSTSAKETGSRSARPAAGPAPTPQPSAREEVQITSLSSQLQALEKSLSGVDVSDAARVEAIKQAISEGRLKVDNSVVADRLLNTVKELLFRQKG